MCGRVSRLASGDGSGDPPHMFLMISDIFLVNQFRNSLVQNKLYLRKTSDTLLAFLPVPILRVSVNVIYQAIQILFISDSSIE